MSEITVPKKMQDNLVSFIDQNKDIVLTTMEDYTRLGDILGIAKKRRKELEDFRLEITGPFTKQVKAIKAKFDAVGQPADDFIEMADRKMKEFFKAEQQRKDDEQKHLDEAAASSAGSDGVLVPIVNEISSQRGASGSTNMRKVKRVRILDADTVPREFCSPDEDKLYAFLEAHPGLPAPAGTEYYDDLILSSRSR